MDDRILLTATHRAGLPRDLRARFRDLDAYLRDVILLARDDLLFISPYLGPAGMVVLHDPIAAAAERGAWIRILTGDLDGSGGMNRRALVSLLEGPHGAIIRKRLRVLTGSLELPVMLHAKVVVADRRVGYLGSANLSARALEENLEVGAALSAAQSRSLVDLVSYLESRGVLTERTATLGPP